jgi:hypothetical protein
MGAYVSGHTCYQNDFVGFVGRHHWRCVGVCLIDGAVEVVLEHVRQHFEYAYFYKNYLTETHRNLSAS